MTRIVPYSASNDAHNKKQMFNESVTYNRMSNTKQKGVTKHLSEEYARRAKSIWTKIVLNSIFQCNSAVRVDPPIPGDPIHGGASASASQPTNTSLVGCITTTYLKSMEESCVKRHSTPSADDGILQQ